MDYTQEEYSRFYIVQALFKLMNENDYYEIKITDIVKKAGVGRATFYRYFKKKEDVLTYYFEHNAKDYANNQHFYPRCKEDYIRIVTDIMTMFKQHKEPIKLIKKARLECLYLDYLNDQFSKLFGKEYSHLSILTPYLYAGMLFNLSMKWLENDCEDNVEELAGTIINAIYK